MLGVPLRCPHMLDIGVVVLMLQKDKRNRTRLVWDCNAWSLATRLLAPTSVRFMEGRDSPGGRAGHLRDGGVDVPGVWQVV